MPTPRKTTSMEPGDMGSMEEKENEEEADSGHKHSDNEAKDYGLYSDEVEDVVIQENEENAVQDQEVLEEPFRTKYLKNILQNSELNYDYSTSAKSEEINTGLNLKLRKRRSVSVRNISIDNFIEDYHEKYANRNKTHKRRKRSNGFVYMMKDVILNQIVASRIDLTTVQNNAVFKR